MKREKIVSLQVLRALSFLMIFFFHVRIGNIGALAVSIFLVLSGFVMTYSFKEEKKFGIKDSLEFALSKIKKLYPLHIVTMGAILALEIFTCFVRKIYINPFVVICNLFFNASLLQSLIPIDKTIFSFNGVSWYLSVCMIIYLLFPMIYSFLKKNNKKKNYIGNIIITFCIQFTIAFFVLKINIELSFVNFERWITYIFPFFRLGDFFIGCNLGFLYKKYYHKISKYKSLLLEMITILLIIIVNYIYATQTTFLSTDAFKYTIISIPIAILLVYLFSYNNGIITKLLSKSKILINIGNVSGYLFLIHQVIIKYMDKVLDYLSITQLNKFLIISIEFFISYLIAILYYNILIKKVILIKEFKVKKQIGKK